MRHTDSTGKRDALMKIMNATYHDIRAIELEHGLSVGGTDYRPRIEYFHDALRVLSHQPEQMYVERTRLSVEHLAYDMSCLRYIQERPLAKLNHEDPAPRMRNAPVQHLLLAPPPGAVMEPVQQPKPVPPTTRAVLADHYRSYTVMYAALFAESADINFQTRSSENDVGVEDMAQIEQMLQMLEQGTIAPERVEEAIQHIENEQVRQQLMMLLHNKSMKKREKMNAMKMLLQQQMQALDMETKAMDKAHMSFLTGQMLMFHDAKDLVRKLSGQGLCLAGQFLENAMSQAAGRGQGQGR